MARPMNPNVFWHKTKKSGDCLLWTGAVGKSGYGAVGYQYKNWSAHRLAWFFINGEIPNGLIVCHKCDNKLCVNPDHLWLGTHQDNSHDMVRKGRSAKGKRSPARLYPESLKRGDDHWSRQKPKLVTKGSRHHKAKITESTVKSIRERVSNGENIKLISEEFDMHLSSIYLMVNRKTWKHVK